MRRLLVAVLLFAAPAFGQAKKLSDVACRIDGGGGCSSGVALQPASPGTAQTGNINITGAGIFAGNVILNDSVLKLSTTASPDAVYIRSVSDVYVQLYGYVGTIFSGASGNQYDAGYFDNSGFRLSAGRYLGWSSTDVFGTIDTTLSRAAAGTLALGVAGDGSGTLRLSRVYKGGTTPTAPSGGGTCGTSAPSIVGNDNAMALTVGSVSATSCTITFATAWATNAPICNANASSTATGIKVTTSTSTVVVSATALTPAEVIYVQCVGRF